MAPRSSASAASTSGIQEAGGGGARSLRSAGGFTRSLYRCRGARAASARALPIRGVSVRLVALDARDLLADQSLGEIGDGLPGDLLDLAHDLADDLLRDRAERVP